MEEQAADLQYRLNDLHEKGDVVINIEDDCWWTTESKTCSLLQSFDPTILTFAKATEIAFDQGCLYNLSPPFSPQKALLLLDFFITQAQTNVLLARQQKLAVPPTIGGTSKNFRQNLIRMIDLLSPSSSPATKFTREDMPTNIIDLIKCLNAKVAQVKQKQANKGDYLVDKTSMSVQEMTSVREIMKDMNADFSMRKKTALQRLDLTLQSFMWSPNAEGKEEEIIAVLRPLVAILLRRFRKRFQLRSRDRLGVLHRFDDVLHFLL